jgi:hypothetical protein
VPELPEVTQEFDADVQPYLDGIALMIEATQKFAEEVNNAISDVDALNAAIRALPDEKTIHLNVDTTGMPEAAAAAAGTGNVAPDTAGMAAEAAADEAVGDAADEADAKVRLLSEAEDANAAAALRDAAAQEALRAAAEDAGAGFARAGENAYTGEAAFARLDEILKEQGGDWEEVDVGAGRAAESLDEVGLSYREMVEQGILPADSALRGAGDAADETRAAYESLIDQGLAPADAAWAAQYTRIGATSEALSSAGDAALTDAEHLGAVGNAAEVATVPFTALGLAARDATVSFAAVGDDLVRAGADAEETAGGFGLLGSAANAVVNGFASVEETWKNTNVVWGLSLNALHWIVMGSMELAAVAVPALVAFGAAADVGLQGAVETGQRLESVYTVTESLGGAFNTTGGEALGLKGNLQAAQNAADPEIWELLGAAINGVKDTSGSFVQMGTQVIGTLDRFAAAVDVELAGAFGGQLTGLMKEGATDLTEFGQVLGNVGHLIANLASEMPGLAEVLLKLLSGTTGFAAALIGAAGPLTTFAMGVEESWRWGGLLSNMLGSVTTKASGFGLSLATGLESLSNFGRDAEDSEEALTGWRAAAAGASEGALGLAGGLESAGAVLSGPWGWVIIGAAAGLTLLIMRISEAKSAAQQFVSGLEQAINGANVTQGFSDITAGLTAVQTKLTETGEAAKTTGTLVTASGSSFKGLDSSVSTAVQAVNTYKTAQTQLTGQAADVIAAGAEISSKWGLSVPAAFSAADNAGLKVGTMFNSQGQLTKVALQQIQNYIQGLQIMSGNSSALGNNINAVNYQLGLQGSQVSKLNSAWDNFMSVVTGGTAAWASLSDDLQQLGNTASTVGGKIQAFTGTSVQGMQQIGQSLKSFGGTSAQVWQNFDAALTQANTVTDWWRTSAASGATNSKQLTEAIATTTAQFVPYVGSSKAALAETMALAQEAGGPAYNASKSLAQNYQTLKTWTDQNAVSQSKYNTLLGNATAQLSNVSQAAQQFSQTLQSDVAQAVAAGSVNLNQVTKDTQNFTTALQHNQPQSKAVTTDIDQMAGQFYHSGMNAQSAASLIYQLGIDQGLTKNQAQGLAGEMTTAMNNIHGAGNAAHSTSGNMDGLEGSMHGAAGAAYQLAMNINDIPNSKNVYVNVQEALTGTVGAGGILPTLSGHAAGYRVPGYGGGDVHPAMLEGGEAVVPKHLTPTVAPFLKAHGVPGFEGGGIMGSDGGYGGFGGGGDRPIHVHVEMNGTQVASALIPSLTAANGRYAVRNSGKATGVWKPV